MSDARTRETTMGDATSLLSAWQEIFPTRVLHALECVFIEQGLQPVIRRLSVGGPVGLQIGSEVIQATIVDGRCILITESGKVLGFGGEAEVIDEILEIVRMADGRG